MAGRTVDLSIAELRRARVVRLLDVLYGGNQRRAARELGVSQAQLSRVIGGQRPVTDRLVDALTQQPGVNPRWLFDGEGELLLPSTHGTLPVAQAILPGSPRDYAGLLTGDRHPVAEALERDTSYWLSVRPYWSPLLGCHLWIAPDDLLLVETDRSFLDRLDVVAGRLCAASVSINGGQIFVLGVVTVEHGSLSVNVFDVTGEAVDPSNSPASSASSSHSWERPTRRVGRMRTRPDDDGGQASLVDTAAELNGEDANGPPGAGDRPSSLDDGPARRLTTPQKIRLSGLACIVGVVLKLERTVLTTPSDQPQLKQ